MELIKRVVAGEADCGKRLDSFLSDLDYDELDFEPSRSYLQRLIADNCVIVAGAKAKAGYKLRMLDEIVISIAEPQAPEIKAENIPLNVVYENHDLIVINKAQGMVVHPAEGNYSGTLVNALMYHCSDLSGINGCLRPGIVHRLDKMTSGLLVVAKNDFAHLSLSDQIKQRTVLKQYLALVHGAMAEQSGIIDAPIGRSPKDRKKMAVVENGREARTSYKVLERLGNYTLLAVTLETGRTHQIRIHLKYLGFPVVDDPAYGPAKNHFKLPGQFLHSAKLDFDHPRTGERMHFEAELPDNMQAVLNGLRKAMRFSS